VKTLEDVLQAKEWAKEYSFDAIISTDGDADRPLIGDECGNWLRGDVVGILCAKFLSADIVVTPVSSTTLTEKSGWFNRVARTKIGSPYVIDAMHTFLNNEVTNYHQTVAGFEANGGFLLGTDVITHGRCLGALPTRDAVLPILALLSLAKRERCSMSELPKTLPSRYTASDRIQNVPTEQSALLIDKLNQDHHLVSKLISDETNAVVSVDCTDGFRATLQNGDIVHLRPSGNAPELRCYAESETFDRALRLCQQCLSNLELACK